MTEIRRNGTAALAVLLGIAAIGCTSPTATPDVPGPPPPPVYTGPSFSISFGSNHAHTVVPGEVLTIDLLIQRDEGFEGAIELTASDAPGIVVIFRPATVLHRDDSDLLVVADQSTQRRTHQIEFTGRSEGVPAKTTTLSLTVVDSK